MGVNSNSPSPAFGESISKARDSLDALILIFKKGAEKKTWKRTKPEGIGELCNKEVIKDDYKAWEEQVL